MGGEPERDEGGLPPVDIEIPDDARELDRDIHAYYREQRAQRRRRRVQRLIAPFTGHGMVLPLIVGTLAVTLFAGTMLTVITSAPEPTTPLPRPPRSIASSSIPPDGRLGGRLPSAVVLIDNKPSALRELRPSVLALVPRNCRCLTALRQLTAQAIAARISVYLVGTDGRVKQVAELAAQAGGYVRVLDDVGNVLNSHYHPIGLTAILVHEDSVVTTVERQLSPPLHLQTVLTQLIHPGFGHLASPIPG